MPEEINSQQSNTPQQPVPQQSAPQTIAPQQAPLNANEPQQKKSSSGCLIVGIILAVVVVLGIIGLVIMFVLGRGFFNKIKDEAGSLSSVTAVATTSSYGATTEAALGLDGTAIDEMITSTTKAAAAPGITGVKVAEKVYYSDASGTIWLKYVVTPIPENAADPLTGIMKKVKGSDWVGVDYGTAGLASGLPSDVVAGLGITD